MAGLLPGCAILKIDGVDIKGLTDPEVRDLTHHFESKYACMYLCIWAGHKSLRTRMYSSICACFFAVLLLSL
jgi:hypothetical protein